MNTTINRIEYNFYL